MKKFTKVLALLIAGMFLVIGCSKNESQKVRKPSANIDSSKWIDNLIDGKAAAEKENKKIFLFFSADDQDATSKQFKDNVFNTPEFLEVATKDYVLVNLDFSNSLFESAQANPIATEEEQKSATELMARLEENMKDASIYNVQASPSFFLLTKEGYVIDEIIFKEVLKNIDEFTNEMNSRAEKFAEYMNVLDSTKSGKVTERVSAIERLFDITPNNQRYPLKSFSKLVLDIDKKNESGVVGKHAIALANANAMEHYMNRDAESASEEFAKLSKNKFLTAQEKQQCFYTAGYLLSQSGSMNYSKIKEYFQNAYDADPESQYAATIQAMVKSVEEMEAEFAKEVEAAKNPENNTPEVEETTPATETPSDSKE